MHTLQSVVFRALGSGVLCAVLAACAPAPLYKTGPSSVTATPDQVATAPQNFHGLHVVWGGSVVSVTNLQTDSEIEILAYPLDSSQRPRTNKPAVGRFIVLVPGFVEPMNFPPGALVTVSGTLAGTREGRIGEAPYKFTLLQSDGMHRWTAGEMRQGHPNINIGVGVGGWIH